MASYEIGSGGPIPSGDEEPWLDSKDKRIKALKSENAELRRDRDEAREAVRVTADKVSELLDALDHCHVCGGQLALDDVHCENCSWDCEEHDEPACKPLYALLSEVRSHFRSAMRPIMGGAAASNETEGK